MRFFIDKVVEIYGAITELPSDHACFHDPALNLTWIEMLGGPYGGVYDDFSEVRARVFDRIAVEWEAFKFVPSAFHNMGNIVVAEGDYTGINRITSKTLNARVIHLWKLVDGNIRFEQFTDTALFMEAINP